MYSNPPEAETTEPNNNKQTKELFPFGMYSNPPMAETTEANNNKQTKELFPFGMYSNPPMAETTEPNIVNLKNHSYTIAPTKIGGTKLVNFIFDYQDLPFSNN